MKNEKPIFIIINLWEYEIIDNPYYEIIKDIIRNIKLFIRLFSLSFFYLLCKWVSKKK